MRLHEQVDQQRPDRHRIVTDLVVARRRKLAQLQPVEHRLAGDRRAVLRRASSLPSATAISGSWRSSSSSLNPS